MMEVIDFFNLGSHVPRLAFLPCKERVEGSIPFGSTIFAGDYVSKAVFFGDVSLIGKAVVLKTTSNHLRRGVSVRVRLSPQKKQVQDVHSTFW